MLTQEDNILFVTSTDVPLTYCGWHFVAMGSYRTLRLNMHDSDFPNSSSSLVSANFFDEVKVKCELNSTWKTNRNLSCVTAWYLGYVFGFGINILLILLFYISWNNCFKNSLVVFNKTQVSLKYITLTTVYWTSSLAHPEFNVLLASNSCVL